MQSQTIIMFSGEKIEKLKILSQIMLIVAVKPNLSRVRMILHVFIAT